MLDHFDKLIAEKQKENQKVERQFKRAPWYITKRNVEGLIPGGTRVKALPHPDLQGWVHVQVSDRSVDGVFCYRVSVPKAKYLKRA